MSPASTSRTMPWGRRPPGSRSSPEMAGLIFTTPAVRAAYDAIAGAYDAQVARSSWVRARLWQRLDALFPPGARVLDATAGTGADALHLAARGVAVTACDLSPAMLDRRGLGREPLEHGRGEVAGGDRHASRQLRPAGGGVP